MISDREKEKKSLPSYVLITPARNEAAFIELTIESMIKQTVLPIKWVIVSDGSTDGTDDIVRKYTTEHKWIELVRMPERAERHFAGKVHAFNAGYARVRDLKYDVIGSLDADISFDEDYFFYLMGRFAENPQLGVAGTPFREGTHQYDYRFTSIEHVSGACQLFRRECFEGIGGYVPIQGGGIDWLAVLTARMKGWKTMTFTEKFCVHHRTMGTGMYSGLMVKFRGGYHDYLMGVNAVWQLLRSVYQMRKRPFLVGGCTLFAGYSWAMVTRAERLVTKEVIEFQRKEEMHRLRDFFTKLFVPTRFRQL
ncbi:MAG: glycosyltransferase family 2 protein [Desulfobulbaceae bacterium]|nr:glycosyltransferase family 2 protein [Desulfobulbaceae bacterium]